MTKKPTFNMQALTDAVAHLSASTPDEVTLDHAIGDAAPLLRQLAKLGWTDQSVVAAFVNAGVSDEAGVMILLTEIRRRERAARKRRRAAPRQKPSADDTPPVAPVANHPFKPIVAGSAPATGFKKNTGV